MNTNLSELFSPYKVKNRVIPNRLVAQAMEVNSASMGGAVNDIVVERYTDLARGGWGIVFLEATSVTEKHLARRNGLVLNQNNLDGFKRLVEAFKKENDSILFIAQLTHSGRQSGSFSKKVKAYVDDQEEIPVLSEKELDLIQEQFLTAIDLAKQAGFDGVDVKACHGYLGGELLRPLNNRSDKYGGSVENRAGFHSRIIETVSSEASDFLVGTRVSLFEGIRGGCGTASENEIIEDFGDMIKIINCFVEAGADYLNISSGIPSTTPLLTRPMKNGSFYRLSHFRYTKQIKDAFPDTLVIGSTYTTGEESCLEFAAENLSKGYTDFVGFGRQNLADPLFPEKGLNNQESINYCTLCGQCSKLLKNDENVYCKTHFPAKPAI
ncbi:hypothetical protein KJ966_02665 [bacterium]|nr:hypothetical protein [bacterium]